MITIRKSDDTYLASSYCDGDLEENKIDKTCIIPLDHLRSTSYNLVQGNSVNAKVMAHNYYGWSALSDMGSGAIIVVVPLPPVGLANTLAITSASVIGLTWNDQMNTGGAPI